MTADHEESLTVEGTGILATHVKWEEVEEALRQHFKTEARFGPNKSAGNVADGVGFTSIVALVEPDWVGAAENEHLPSKTVVKLPTMINTLKITAALNAAHGGDDSVSLGSAVFRWAPVVRRLHNAEIAFYDFVRASKVCNKKLLLPAVYCWKRFSDSKDPSGFLVMEYVPSVWTAPIYYNLGKEQLDESLRAWAQLQALTYDDGFLNHADVGGENNFEAMYDAMMGPEERRKMLQFLAKNFPELSELVGKVSAQVDDIQDFPRLGTECERIGMKPVLCHGDLWSSNLMWDAESKELKCIIDYQVIYVGGPGCDIARMLLTSISGEERRKSQDDVLETYFKYFKSFMGDRQLPYTLDQLKASYYSALPLACMLAVPMFGPVTHYAKLMAKDDAEREKIHSSVREKAEAMLEDMLHQHELNQKH
ncbi:unnamed protein product, partial [Mesorhabditis spiculigera]